VAARRAAAWWQGCWGVGKWQEGGARLCPWGSLSVMLTTTRVLGAHLGPGSKPTHTNGTGRSPRLNAPVAGTILGPEGGTQCVGMRGDSVAGQVSLHGSGRRARVLCFAGGRIDAVCGPCGSCMCRLAGVMYHMPSLTLSRGAGVGPLGVVVV
jgi:hypothetical protein